MNLSCLDLSERLRDLPECDDGTHDAAFTVVSSVRSACISERKSSISDKVGISSCFGSFFGVVPCLVELGLVYLGVLFFRPLLFRPLFLLLPLLLLEVRCELGSVFLAD